MLQQYIRQFTEKVIDALNVGSMEMVNLQETMLTPDFILIGLLDQEDSVIVKLLQTYFADDKTLANQIVEKVYKEQDAVKKIKITAIHTIQLSPETEILFKQAAAESKNLGDKYIGSGAMFLAMFDPRVGRVSGILLDLGLKYQKVKEALEDMQGGRHINDKSAEGRFEALNRYTTDLTDMARKGELDPVIARENEINRVIQVLSRRKKNNPVLIGETGVGKTVIVDGLAQQIVRAEVPKSLLNKRVKVLEMSEIIAGAKMRGEFEERMKAVKDEIIAANGRIILFIDELHTLVSSGSGGGGIDASDMLKSALAKGQLQCIGATTLDEYKKHIETDKALARRFQPIIVQEPSVKDAVRILSGLKPRYEKHHGVVFREDALTAAAKLSEKYISDRALPDKAVDLLDEAGAQKHLTLNYIPPNIRQLENQKIGLQQSQKDYFAKQDFQEVARIRQELIETEAKLDKETIKWKKDLEKIDASVSDEDIANVDAAWTNIPVNKIRETEANKLMHMEDNLHKRVIGQDNAITALSNAIRRTRAGLKDKDRPIGSFLFPTSGAERLKLTI